MRAFVYPNVDEENKRGVLVMEPEVLIGIDKDNKMIPLSIGFYFGKDGTQFEVFTPSTISWRGLKTPINIWKLAKSHALAADSMTH